MVNYLEIMTSEKDITLVGYFKLVWQVLKEGGMKVWLATLVMHLTRLAVVIGLMVYFANYSVIGTLPYSILITLSFIPFDWAIGWKMSMIIKHRFMTNHISM